MAFKGFYRHPSYHIIILIETNYIFQLHTSGIKFAKALSKCSYSVKQSLMSLRLRHLPPQTDSTVFVFDEWTVQTHLQQLASSPSRAACAGIAARHLCPFSRQVELQRPPGTAKEVLFSFYPQHLEMLPVKGLTTTRPGHSKGNTGRAKCTPFVGVRLYCDSNSHL